jgi:hypothetical protein
VSPCLIYGITEINVPYPADRLRSLEDENRRLSNTLVACLDDINGIRLSQVSRSVRLKHLTHVQATEVLSGRV